MQATMLATADSRLRGPRAESADGVMLDGIDDTELYHRP
jgi:hypothetical protein